MSESDSKTTDSKGRSTRIIALVLLGLVAIMIVMTVIVFPGMEPFFRRKGFDYARQKLIATLPAIDGYNPEIHKHDPLEVTESFTAVTEALKIDTLLTDEFRDRFTVFMTVFKNRYDDQIIVPDERDKIILALDSLQKYLLTTHFAGIVGQLRLHIAGAFPESSRGMQGALGFDSLAIYTPGIKLKMTGALSLRLINSFYTAMADNKIDSAESKTIGGFIRKIERFQIRNELQAVIIALSQTTEFEDFPEKEAFLENITLILDGLRDMTYDYSHIKSTLRSIVLLWHEQRTSPESMGLDLIPIYEFTKYAGYHVIIYRSIPLFIDILKSCLNITQT